jgi:hypothetical protein
MTHTFVLHTKAGTRLPQSAVDTLTFMLETFGVMASPSKAIVAVCVNQPSTSIAHNLPDCVPARIDAFAAIIHQATPPNLPRIDMGVRNG